MPEQEACYAVKRIQFHGRRVPILLQDANGPCPLIAIANILLLRDRLNLPAGVGEVSQERLVALVAEHLLDANSVEGRTGLSEDYKANLQHNLADAIALLPKLTTGVDVNVRFHDIRGFEYTNETAVFDLLGIPLVHGWLVDDPDTAAAFGQKSYNEVVMALVTALGTTATPRQLTPKESLRRGAVPSTAAAAAGAIDAGMLAAALQSSLRVSTQGGRPSLDTTHGSMPTTASSVMSEGTTCHINSMLTDLVKQAFASDSLAGAPPSAMPAPCSARAAGQHAAAASGANAVLVGRDDELACSGTPSAGLGLEETVALQLSVDNYSMDRPVSAALLVQLQPPRQLSSPFASTTLESSSAAPAVEASATGRNLVLAHACATAASLPEAGTSAQPDAQQELGAERSAEQSSPVRVVADTGATSMQTGHGASGSGSQPAAADAVPAVATLGSDMAGAGGSRDMRDALLMQQFLDSHPSQLTYHGLLSLHEGLKDGQLAVFFRNNHFNTLYAHSGRLFILATDVGFQFESDVVWEQLSSVDGDTQLVDSSFAPFVNHAAAGQGSSAGATTMTTWDSAAAAHAAAHGGADAALDADLALALQLQAEEEERIHVEEQRLRVSAARHAVEQQTQAGLARQPAAQPQQQRPAPSQPKKDKKVGNDCVLM